MILGLSFAEPLLLLGIAAAALPFLLHLLSSVRAKEVTFPTLRFLQLSMEKTARRRRVQHWLLLLLRALVLGLLALAVAQPISDAAGGWIDAPRLGALVVLDNSYSMAAGTGSSSMEKARQEAREIFAADPQPVLAGLMTTSGGYVSEFLTTDMDLLRSRLEQVRVGHQPNTLSARVSQAIALLASQPDISRKAVYVLTDFQRNTMEDLTALRELGQGEEVHVLLVDVSDPSARNVGISDLEVKGHSVAGATVRVKVGLTNSSDASVTVGVELKDASETIDGPRVVQLAPGGQDGSNAAIEFSLELPRAGTYRAQAVLSADDALAEDNQRWLALKVAPKAKALIVQGPAAPDVSQDPSAFLELALSPGEVRRPVETRKVDYRSFAPGDLADCSAAFFCEVPDFSSEQVAGIRDFVAGGNVAVFFLGPDTRPDLYNRKLIGPEAQADLLPARLAGPVGALGLDVPAVRAGWADLKHPVLAGLYPRAQLYLDRLLVQRYFQLEDDNVSSQSRPLVRLVNGDPIVLARSVGRGRSVLITVPASFRWSSLPRARIFLPLMTRLALMGKDAGGEPASYPAGARVTVRPDVQDLDTAELSLTIQPPARGEESSQEIVLGVQPGPEGPLAVFDRTDQPGLYRWKLLDPQKQVADEGAFAIHSPPGEGQLARVEPEALVENLRLGGLNRVYAGQSVQQVHAAAAADTVGRNWWDLLAAGVIVLLVIEAVVANRNRSAVG